MQNKKAENHHSNVTVLSFLFIANRFLFINTSCGDFLSATGHYLLLFCGNAGDEAGSRIRTYIEGKGFASRHFHVQISVVADSEIN